MLLHKNHQFNLVLAAVLALLLALLLLILWATPVYAVEPPTHHWHGEYYNNVNLTGTPVLVRNDEQINFVWGWNAPAPEVNAEQFSARWSRSITVEPGTYRFAVTTDDGVRLWVNNYLLIDSWYDHGPATNSGEIYLAGSDIPLRMEYYENREYATARLSWARTDLYTYTPHVYEPYVYENYYYELPYNDWYDHYNEQVYADEWRGEYFDNRYLDGSPEFVRYDAEVDFDWGNSSPRSSRIGEDNFSVRWTTDRYFSAGRYQFDVTCDDGVRLYVDDDLVMDDWHDMPATRMTKYVTLDSGVHEVRLEYYEHRGDAVVQLDWNRLESEPEIGNIITCAPPQPYNNAWVKIYRLEDGHWELMTPNGIGAIDANGVLKIDGLPVDVDRYGDSGHPYCVEVFLDGRLINACGNTAQGQSEFRLFPNMDNYTPWQCGVPY